MGKGGIGHLVYQEMKLNLDTRRFSRGCGIRFWTSQDVCRDLGELRGGPKS